MTRKVGCIECGSERQGTHFADDKTLAYIAKLERELAEEKQRRERAEGFLAGIAESMGDAGYPLAVDTVHAFLRDTADPNVNWGQK